MHKIILLIIFILIITNSYSQNRSKLGKQGFVKSENYLVELPFRYINKHIFIEVMISDKKYNFLFDTGYELSSIDSEIANEIDFKIKKEVEISGSSILNEKVTLVELPNINIATVIFENTYGILQNLSFIKKNYDSLKVSGVIGNNLIRKANWQIDYHKKIIKISSRAENLNISKMAYSVKMNRKNWGLAYLDLTINNKKHKFIFDLGSNGAFTAGLHFKKYFDPKNIEIVKPDLFYQVHLQKIELGKIKISNKMLSLQKGVSPLIGNSFFDSYILTIDWNKNRLYLYPQNEF